jgi:hypothetical protein
MSTANVTQTGQAAAVSVTVSRGLPGAPGATGATGAPGTTDYNELNNVPTEFPPSAHDHAVSNITPVSSQHLLGRHANGSGDAQEVTVSGGLEFSGSGIRRAALTGDITAAAGSDSTTLANVGTAGTYRSVTTDAKGRVIVGTNPTTLDGYGITDAAALVHTHVSDDITDATDNAVAGKIAKYTSSSGLFALGLELYNGTGSTEFQAEAGAEDYTINVPASDGTLVLTSDLTAKANLTGGNTFSGTQSNTGEVRSSAALSGDTTQLPNLAQTDSLYGRLYYASGELSNDTTTPQPIASLTALPAGTYHVECDIYIQTANTETIQVNLGLTPGGGTWTRRQRVTYTLGSSVMPVTSIAAGGAFNAAGNVSLASGGSVGGRGLQRVFGQVVLTTTGTLIINASNDLAGKGTTVCFAELTARRVG